MVTPEPDTEAGHVWREEEEITHYHVEFLGEPHSHGWVCARDVEAFTAHSANRHSADGSHPVTAASHSQAGGRATATSARARACVCVCARACAGVRVCAHSISALLSRIFIQGIQLIQYVDLCTQL